MWSKNTDELEPLRPPPWGRRGGRPRIRSFESRWVTVDGLSMHHRTDPDPPSGLPLILVHGMGVASGYLEPVGKILARHRPVFIPDLPGYGDTAGPGTILSLPELADALDRWMEAVGLDKAALLGNSFGCEIVVEMALRHPERIDRAILQGPTPDPHHRGAIRQIVRWQRNKNREAKLEGVPSMSPIARRDYAQAGFRRMVRTFQMMLRDRIEDKLPQIDTPTLVVGGTVDTITPPEWIEEAADLLPMGTYRIIPGAPHTANYFTPLELARVVRPFLDLPHGRLRRLHGGPGS